MQGSNGCDLWAFSWTRTPLLRRWSPHRPSLVRIRELFAGMLCSALHVTKSCKMSQGEKVVYAFLCDSVDVGHRPRCAPRAHVPTETRTPTSFIPRDQKGPSAPITAAPRTPAMATQTWPAARQPTAVGVPTQTLASRSGARVMQSLCPTPGPAVEANVPQKPSLTSTSPRSPRHRDFVPSFPATFLRTYEHTHQLQPLPDYRGQRFVFGDFRL